MTATDQVCLEKAAADALAGALDGLTSALEASGAIDKSVVAKLDVAAALQLELGEAIQTIGDRLPQAR